MWSITYVIEKSIYLYIVYIYRLNSLDFVHIVVFDNETALENAKLVILEQKELKNFLCCLSTTVRCVYVCGGGSRLGNFSREYFPVF